MGINPSQSTRPSSNTKIQGSFRCPGRVPNWATTGTAGPPYLEKGPSVFFRPRVKIHQVVQEFTRELLSGVILVHYIFRRVEHAVTMSSVDHQADIRIVMEACASDRQHLKRYSNLKCSCSDPRVLACCRTVRCC